MLFMKGNFYSKKEAWVLYIGLLVINFSIAVHLYAIKENAFIPVILSFLGVIIGVVQLTQTQKTLWLYCISLLFIVFSNTSKDANNYQAMLILLTLAVSSSFLQKKSDYLCVSATFILTFQCFKYETSFEIFLNLASYGLMIYFIQPGFYKTFTRQISKKLSFDTSNHSITSSNGHLESNSANTPIMSIISSINSAITLLNEIPDDEIITESVQHLTHALKVLNKSQNIYTPLLKKITKNMDLEDKLFIEQNTCSLTTFDINTKGSVQHIRINCDMVYGVSELSGILKQIGKEWNFNTFFVSDCTGGAVLYTCGEYVFNYYSLYSWFSIDPSVSKSFLTSVESKYIGNPYHNSCHSADVMISFLYLCNPVLEIIPCVELLASILACIGHDLGHPGTNNRFLIQTKNQQAVNYNDNSVLENMHARDLFTILLTESSNILKNVSDYWVLRKIIIELILATDMAKHFELLGT